MTSVRQSSQHGGSLVLVLLIVTALLGGAGVALYVQMSDTRSVGLVRQSRQALFCAESGLAIARGWAENNPGTWAAILDANTGNNPGWYPVRGSVGDGDTTDDFEVTFRDNPDEPAGTNDNPLVNNDQAIFLVSRCLKYPDAPGEVIQLVDTSVGGGFNYRGQGGCGAGNTGNCN